MYIQTSVNDSKEFSKILTKELLKNFTNAVKSNEEFYVKNSDDFENIAKLYNLKIEDLKNNTRLIGVNQVLVLKSDGKLLVEGVRHFGSEQDATKLLRVFKNYFGYIELGFEKKIYRTYYTSYKSLSGFSEHLTKTFNTTVDTVGSDFQGIIGKILFIARVSPFSDQISLKLRTNLF